MSDSLVAIVTGGAQGLGASIAELLLKKGYKVCVADIQEAKGKQFVKDLQGVYGEENVAFHVCDVSNEDDFKGVFEAVVRQFQRIDVLVNNAGIVDESNAKRTIAVNLMGTIIGSQLAIQYMGKSSGGKGGMVINVSSRSGFRPVYRCPLYSASKHGIIGFTRAYGYPDHLEKEGILFAALCPGITDTPILDDAYNKVLLDGVKRSDQDPMSPDYVAEGILKLLDDRINGSTLLVMKSDGFQYIELPEMFKMS